MILVYDVTDKKSFDDIENWFKLIKENSSGRQFVLVIIGNKSDLIHQRQVVEKRYGEVQDNIDVIEVSAINIDKIKSAVDSTLSNYIG